ncbi:MAG: HDOD domain-containing protein [Proteobacteria bacterium]|nr:HDOD domain-containing protein [Pseudomonadota bacterium]MBU1737466.1 HDOD domain-containing protein [Pseudomonadota bacterium]
MAKKSPTELGKQIEFLKNISFFSNFDDHELTQFLAVSTWLKAPEGTLIIKENTVEKVFYILVKGEVSVFKDINDSGDTIELTTLSTGDCFGEMALVSEARRTAGVITTTESFILKVEPEIINTSNVFLQLKFYKRFCEIMVARLAMANQRAARKEEGNGHLQPIIPQDQPPVSPKPPTPTAKETLTPDPEPSAPPPMPEKKDRQAKTHLQGRIQGNQPLAVNPLVAAKIKPFLSGGTINTRMMTDLLYLDPALSFRILKVANSSLYRRSCQIITVPHAIVSVGPNIIQEVVREAIEDSKQIRPFGGYKKLALSFWRHSVTVAGIAVMLKDIIRITNIGPDVYLAGLLHDLGMLVLDQYEPDFYPQLIAENHEFADLQKGEREYVGADHSSAGKWLAEKTGLPQAYMDVMQYHHHPERAGDSSVLTSLVHLADLFATSRGIPPIIQETEKADPFQSSAWTILRTEVKTFGDVNVADFIEKFNQELDRTWAEVSGEHLF